MMESLVVALFISLGVNLFLALIVKAMSRDIREVATEALLSSKATSAEDLSVAAATAHQAREDRLHPPKAAAPVKPDTPDPFNRHVTLPNGKVVEVLRPL